MIFIVSQLLFRVFADEGRARYGAYDRPYGWDDGYERFTGADVDRGCASAYEVLGVGQNASVDEIKTAYRKLAVRFHPDKYATQSVEVQKEAEKKFQEVNEAYDKIKKSKGFS
ncbi:MAG: DnaJ family molecular chaperone [Candidatus Cryptobacteroides sp.]